MSDRTKGILAIVASAFGFALMAAFIRLADDFGSPISSFQKSFFRNLVAVALAAGVFWKGHRKAARRETSGVRENARRVTRVGGKAWALILLRSALGTIGIFANFYALSHIPIAEGQTLNKTAPFFTVIFSWLFMGERANWKQVLALVVAFVGVVFVAKPGFAGDETLPLAMGLLGGVCAGSAYACVHKLGAMKVNASLIILVFSVFSSLASLPFMAYDYTPMTAAQVAILCGVGAGAAIGQFGITAAYRFAEPRQIAVFDYSSILFAALFGFVLFGQVPDALAVLGFALIVIASLRMRT